MIHLEKSLFIESFLTRDSYDCDDLGKVDEVDTLLDLFRRASIYSVRLETEAQMHLAYYDNAPTVLLVTGRKQYYFHSLKKFSNLSQAIDEINRQVIADLL